MSKDQNNLEIKVTDFGFSCFYDPDLGLPPVGLRAVAAHHALGGTLDPPFLLCEATLGRRGSVDALVPPD